MFAAFLAEPANGQGTPVLSRNQVGLIQTLERIASIRTEPRRTELSRTVAAAVEDDLIAAYKKYFGGFPSGLPQGTDIGRQASVGRLVCRFIARESEGMVGIYHRCTLGNLLVNIMHRDDLAVVRKHNTIETARSMMIDSVRRIAYSFLKARGKTPDWSPEEELTRDRILGHSKKPR